MEVYINGVKIFVRDQGRGPAVLLVHAFPLSGAMWEPQVAALAGGYRVIAPDLRGFGQSDAPPGPYLMDTFADDLAAIIDALGLQQVVLGGLSMGGYIAFAFLRRYASRLRGLVLADTRAGPDTEQGREGRETNARLVESEGPAALATKVLPGLLGPAAAAGLRERIRGIIEANRPQGIAAALRGMALRPDASDLLPQIRVPTLILVGADDSLTPPAEAEAMHMAISGAGQGVAARLTTIPGAGHLSSIEQPEAFNSALLEFLQGIEG